MERWNRLLNKASAGLLHPGIVVVFVLVILSFTFFLITERAGAQEKCFGQSPTIVGTDGDDNIQGTNKKDVILGLGGNDTINGGNGKDIICGGDGDDVLSGGNGVDKIDGGVGNDTVNGGNGDDTIDGGPGTDAIDGGKGNDSCLNGENNDDCEEEGTTDSTPPSLNITSPSSSFVNDTSPNIVVNYSDDSSGIDLNSLQILLDSTDITFTCTTNPSSATCQSSDLTEGQHSINAQISDLADNLATADFTLNVDITSPNLQITSPAEGAIQKVSQATIAGNVDDTLSGISTVTCNGVAATITIPTFTCDVTLIQGSNLIDAVATDNAGNTNTVSLTINFIPGPDVNITSPQHLTLFSSSPITVSGTIDDSSATVLVNGVPASATSGTFTATNVPLEEGTHTVTAAATDSAGNVATSIISLVLDTTPPVVIIDTPVDGSTVKEQLVTVTGRVNDIATRAFEGNEVAVDVNGIPASVSNGTFSVPDVTLQSGLNTITATGVDSVGNSSINSIQVTFQAPVGQKINLISGNNQTGVINSILSAPLIVSLTDGNGNPISGSIVTFKVIKGDGSITSGQEQGRQLNISTDAFGQAQVNFTLGSKSGLGFNQVKANSIGFSGEITFNALAISSTATGIKVLSGQNQRGEISKPLPEPLVVFVHDMAGNPVEGVPVVFDVTEGGGNFSGVSSITDLTDIRGRASAVLTLGNIQGANNNVVQANFVGLTELPATFISWALTPGSPQDSKVSGVVLDNTNLPVEGVTVRIEGTSLQTLTDDEGLFTIENVPAGMQLLIADGSTTTRPGTWPELEFEINIVSGLENTLETAIYLLPIDTPSGAIVGGSEDVELSIPNIPGFSMTVLANSVTFPDGSTEGLVSATQVHSDKVPMTPSRGAAPRLVITIQPANVVFDPPARITFPNVAGLNPGQIIELISFDHEQGEFVNVGTLNVSEDGSVVTSDKGFGIRKSGWHYPVPAPDPVTLAQGQGQGAGGGGGGSEPPPTCGPMGPPDLPVGSAPFENFSCEHNKPGYCQAKYGTPCQVGCAEVCDIIDQAEGFSACVQRCSDRLELCLADPFECFN